MFRTFSFVRISKNIVIKTQPHRADLFKQAEQTNFSNDLQGTPYSSTMVLQSLVPPPENPQIQVNLRRTSPSNRLQMEHLSKNLQLFHRRANKKVF
jgi:hypothetical protein